MEEIFQNKQFFNISYEIRYWNTKVCYDSFCSIVIVTFISFISYFIIYFIIYYILYLSYFHELQSLSKVFFQPISCWSEPKISKECCNLAILVTVIISSSAKYYTKKSKEILPLIAIHFPIASSSNIARSLDTVVKIFFPTNSQTFPTFQKKKSTTIPLPQ